MRQATKALCFLALLTGSYAATLTTLASPSASPTTPATTVAAPTTDTPVADTLTSAATPGLGATDGKLTTQPQGGGPTIIVDGSGTQVIFKGIGWYGFNVGNTAPGNLTAGATAVANDFKTVVYRMKMLGFNAIRMPFAFDSHWGLAQPPLDYTAPCPVPTVAAAEATLNPGSSAPSGVKLTPTSVPPVAPPTVPGGICNSDMPSDSTFNRYIWVVQYFISQGFYVNVDFHSNAEGDRSLYTQASWIASWVQLVTSILSTVPQAAGKLLIDLINEPDGYGLTWQQQGDIDSLGSYYLNTIEALYAVCPGCLFLIEGGGQTKYCGVNWGNGFITDENIINSYAISNPVPFFQELLTKPYLSQVVLAPHIYCPEVSGASACFEGTSLYDSLDTSFGTLTASPGFCSGSDCYVFPVLLDEFGSTLNNGNEISCMQSIVQYSIGAANPKTHAPLSSFFFWAWQPDSLGTGGLVGNDWTTIQWEKIGLLSGGVTNFTDGMGLDPWYESDFTLPDDVAVPAWAVNVTVKPFVPTPAPVAAPGAAPTTPSVPLGFINSSTIVSSPTGPAGSITGLSTESATQQLSGSSNSHSGLIAGCVVGGFAFIVLAALFVYFVVLKKA